jgi:hypothetical protein
LAGVASRVDRIEQGRSVASVGERITIGASINEMDVAGDIALARVQEWGAVRASWKVLETIA